jgi:hypothetical protein
MTASLFQLVSTSVSKASAFFTFAPQITFFKTVFLKHEAFAIDTHEQHFAANPDFDEEGFCELEKIGDLISGLILKVKLPKVNIEKSPDSGLYNDYSSTVIVGDDYSLTATQMIAQYNTLITNFTNFSNASMTYWRDLKKMLKNTSSNYNTVINKVNIFRASQNTNQTEYEKYNDFSTTKLGKLLTVFNFDLLDHIKTSFTSYSNSFYNTTLTKEYIISLTKYLDNYILYQKIYMRYLIAQRDTYVIIKSKNESKYYDFAWVANIGLKLINYISIEIGGQIFDTLTDKDINDYYSLVLETEKKELLSKLIGNIDVLTSYDNKLKPTYTVYIPLNFWFSRFKLQALGCVGLPHSSILVKLRLNELHKCCLFEPDFNNIYSSNINLIDTIKISDITMLVEYIQLTKREREKFATYTNETLITQTHTAMFESTSEDVAIPLEFSNLVYELNWTVQKKSNMDNQFWNDYEKIDTFKGYIDTVGQQQPYLGLLFITMNFTSLNSLTYKVTNFSDYANGYVQISHSKYYNGMYKILLTSEQILVIDSKKFIYPDYITITLFDKYKQLKEIVQTEHIEIYNKDLLSRRDPLFFTHAQNYQHHTSIPRGIHTYCFSRNPEIQQPNGHLNFNVVKSKKLILHFNPDIISQLKTNGDTVIISITAKSYNLMEIEKGYARLMFGI